MAIMANASMRFDDALHTALAFITVRGGGVELVSWQTKVERKRRGTIFAVGSESLSGLPWLVAGLEVLKRTAPRSYLKGDFWLFRTDGKRGEFGVPLQDADFVTMLRSMSNAAVKTFITDPAIIDRLLTFITTLTAHSLKATFLSDLAHAHADPQVLMSQAHWRTPEMPAKYTRDRHAVSVKGIKEMIASLKTKWEGEDVNSGIGFSEDEEDETAVERTAVESSVLEQASAPSGGEQWKPHDGDNKGVRQCEAVRAGTCDAAHAEQASPNKQTFLIQSSIKG